MLSVAACEGCPLAASCSGADVHVWSLEDGTPVARLLGEGAAWAPLGCGLETCGS